jgi:hypothetical protein
VPDEPTTPARTVVWQAPVRLRATAYAGMVVIAVLAWRLVAAFGFTATISALFAVAILGWVYWGVLRPRLTAGPDGVTVVLGRTPTRIAWRDLRRCEAGPSGLTIRVTGGTEVVYRWPQRDRGAAPDTTTEADRFATFLVRRADWARKPSGPEPVWEPAPRP